ncbi:MAG TPA: hypothetical protein VN859_02855 [Steroidobacteraceae bacterium]|nr:hypothetical protein [Steroidobacteraceae bacterium]
MMRYMHRLRNAGLALAVLASAALLGTASASTIRQAQVVGHVTAIASNAAISIDGHQYSIGAGTLASQSVATIHIGDMVSLVFDGPPNSSASHVVLIQPLPGGQAVPSGP